MQPRRCAECGAEFTPIDKRQKYCSVRCSRVARNRRWRNEHQQSVVKALRNAGHDIYDFKHPADGDAGFQWSGIDQNWQNWTTQQYRDALMHEYAQFGFNRDFDAMKAGDVCVLVLPCGRSANAEAGWMKGAGKKVFVYIPPGCKIEPELMYKMFDGITSDIREIITHLEGFWK